MFEDFGNLRESRTDKADQDARDGNKYDCIQTDKAVGLGGGIKDGGKFIHQRDDTYRQVGKPDFSSPVIGKQVRPAKQDKEQCEEADIEDGENDNFHNIIAIKAWPDDRRLLLRSSGCWI